MPSATRRSRSGAVDELPPADAEERQAELERRAVYWPQLVEESIVSAASCGASTETRRGGAGRA